MDSASNSLRLRNRHELLICNSKHLTNDIRESSSRHLFFGSSRILMELRDYRKGINRRKGLPYIYERVLLESEAAKLSRRLCCYAHQYLEIDENSNFTPASVYHIRYVCI